jgi:uncharacterized membrane protein YfcA
MELNIFILILLVILAFIAAFVDSSFGMGYGVLTPILINLGFNSDVVVPVLLVSQMSAGFSGTIFHAIYENVELSSKEETDVKITILFTVVGMIATGLAVYLATLMNEFLIQLYIGIMISAVGILMITKISFSFSWKKLYIISGIASFNKAISGGGYGPIATSGQIVSGREHGEAVATTDLSEAFLAGLGFMFYFLFQGFPNIELTIQMLIIMVIASIIATPLGALLAKKIDKDKAKKIIGFISLGLGILTLIRLIFSF